MFRLARAATRLSGDSSAELPWLSLVRSGGMLGLDGTGSAAAGVVSGMTKALAHEWNNPYVRLADLADETPDETYALGLLAQAFLGDELECGYAYGQRIVAVERPWTSSSETCLQRGDVVLVTGGARGVTARVCLELASRYGCRLALVGRSLHPLPGADGPIDLAAEKVRIREKLAATGDRVTPAMVRDALLPFVRSLEIEKTLDGIRTAGGEAIYLSCDVTDRRQVAAAVTSTVRTFGRLDGVIHGAGVEVSKALLDKTEESARRVVETKIGAASNLIWATRDLPLRFLTGFGSVAGRFGNAGQLEYAGANDGLAKMLGRLEHQRLGLRAMTIDWTAWDDVGMAVDGGTRALMIERGIDLLPADLGASLCVDLIAGGAGGEVMVAGALGDLRRMPGPEAPTTGPSNGNGRPKEQTSPGGEPTVATPKAGDGLLETIQVAADGLSAESGVLLESEEPYLDDHRIDGTPVLPGVMAVELCAQTCRHLAGGKPFRGVTEMKFLRPAKLHHDRSLQLTIRAQRSVVRSDGTVLFAVSVHSLREGKTGRMLETEHFIGTLRYGGPGEGPRSPLYLPAAGKVRRGADREAIYKRYFHTGTFATLDKLVAVSDGMAIVEGQISRAPLSTFSDETVTDPLVTEMAFQAGGLQGLVCYSSTFLPARIGRSVKLHNAPAGELLTTRIAVREASEERLIYDAEVITLDGRALARFSEIELVNAGPITNGKRLAPEPLDILVETIADSELPDSAFESIEGLAAGNEAPDYERKKTEKARRQWIVSRTLVKRSIERFYRRYYGIALKATEIEIVKDELGAPEIRIHREVAEGVKAPMISLSHSGGRAIVAIVPPWRAARAGIDLEQVASRSERFKQDFLSENELAVAEQHGSGDSVLTAIWSLKEAASKALGMGMHIDFRTEIEVTAIDREGASIRFKGKAQEQLEHLGFKFSRALWSVEDGFAMAQVELAGGNGGPSSSELASVAALLAHTGHTQRH
jgi:phosphopantetheine--protein transferase-like protein